MDRFKLKVDAAISLRSADRPPRKLILIHSGVAAATALLVALIDQLISWRMDAVGGGLGALDALALLSTVQTVLLVACFAIMPFWAAGLTNVALGIVKGRSIRPKDLLEGFRRSKSLLSSGLMTGAHYLFRGILSTFISTQVLMFTPLAIPLAQAAEKLTDDPTLSAAAVLGDHYLPVMIGCFVALAVVFLAMAAPVFYRYRLISYLILDDGMGGMQAMFTSRMLMQRRRWELFKLDLSYWWYYLLEVLALAVTVMPLILALVGVDLPMPPAVAFWFFLILGIGIMVTVQIWAKAKIWVTYAQLYEQIRKQGPAGPKHPPMQEMPKNVPWNY